MLKETTVTEGIATRKSHPNGLYVLFFTEMWERFGYYLLIGIVFLYMTDNLKGGLAYEEGFANDVYGTFLALVYLTPFIGGLLADRLFGYRRTIILGGVLMAAGYLTLSIPGPAAFYIGLGLVVAGNGFFKPNISTLVGNLYNKPEYKNLKDQGYNIFYMGINVGAFICNFVAAYLRNNYGWGYAFAAAGIGMIFGLIIFISGTSAVKNLQEADTLKPKKPEDMPLSQVFGTIFAPALAFAGLGYFIADWFGREELLGSKSNDVFLFACIPVIYFYLSTYFKASSEDKGPIGSMLYIFAVVIVFWCIFHQNGNVLTDWAEKHTDRQMPASIENTMNEMGFVEKVNAEPKMIDGKEVYSNYLGNLPKEKWPEKGKELNLFSTELFQSINPFFIIILTPVVVAFFSFLRRRDSEPSTASKIAWGLFITGLSTLVMILAVMTSQNGLQKVSFWWLMGTYCVITVGELFLSPMGLSLVSKLSPARLTALMMGGWFLATSIGNKLSGVLGHLGSESPNKSLVFWINFGGAIFAAFLLFLMLKHINRVLREKLQSN